MKVENHNDLGNPYHDNRTGQFSSSNSGASKMWKKLGSGNNSNNIKLQDVFKSMSNSFFVKTLKFILSGLDFNSFKSNRINLNPKVFKSKKKTNNQLSTENIEKFYQKGKAIDNELNSVSSNLALLEALQEKRKKDFGKNVKMYEKWWEKNWEKVFVNNKMKEQQLLAQKEKYNKEKEMLNQKLINKNKALQRGR